MAPVGAIAAAVALALIAAALALALPFYWHRRPATTLSDKSVAVLPLENLSENKEDAFFANGVQDELLSNLAKIKDLKVISRTSVMQYKSGTKRNLKEIAQQLGVSNVVEGSVRRSGDRVRVSVQLIDAQTDRHLWGENYDRTLADSLSLQGELATEIAAAVGATLTPQEKARVEAKPTKNPAAYDAYLRARAILGWGFYARVMWRVQFGCTRKQLNWIPILRWPGHISRLCICEFLDTSRFKPGAVGVGKGCPRSRTRARSKPAGSSPCSRLLFANEGDSSRALAEFRQAEKDVPNSADVIEAIARMQRALGHWDEVVANLQRASNSILAISGRLITWRLPTPPCVVSRSSVHTRPRIAWDPTNARALVTKADALVGTGDLQSAEPLLANPDVPPGRRGQYALYRRNYAAAIDIFSRALATGTNRDRRDPNNILSLGLSQKLAGDVSAARETYQKAIGKFSRRAREGRTGFVFEADAHARLGEAYAGLGEAASAIAEGEKAMALMPTSRYPEHGASFEHQMATIYAQLGDVDHAIPMLQRLLHTSYGGATFLTPAILRLDPTWDPIRDDPRFQELASSPPPS